MKTKAVIMRPDRTNDVITIKKKQMEGKTFRHENSTYILDPDRFQVTWVRRFLVFTTHYATFYYAQGQSQPLPAPKFEAIFNPNGNGDHSSCVSAEEMSAIFNPWFYRTISPQPTPFVDRIMWLLSVASACGIGYIIFRLHNPITG